MPAYLHPGVYIEEIPSGVKPIEGVGTSTAVFVGLCAKGPVAKPTLIHKWEEYQTTYGGIEAQEENSTSHLMGYAVAGFFRNGGGRCYVVRVLAESSGAAALGYMGHPDDATNALRITAVNPGNWGSELMVSVEQQTGDPRQYTIKVGTKGEDGLLEPTEEFVDLSWDDTTPRYAPTAINGVSELIGLEVVERDGLTLPDAYFQGCILSGDLTEVGLSLPDSDEERVLHLSFDGVVEEAFTVPLDPSYPNLKALADSITYRVRMLSLPDGSTVSPTALSDFYCIVVPPSQDGPKLALVSGSRTGGSAVAVGESEAAEQLRLFGVDAEFETFTGTETQAMRLTAESTELVEGENGTEGIPSDYEAVFSELTHYPDINIICLPGNSLPAAPTPPSNSRQKIESAIAHAEQMKNRVVLVDLPKTHQLQDQRAVTALNLPTSSYAVTYYPWLRVTNPYYDSEENPTAAPSVLVSPSGHVAGMWANIDGTRNVWKAPAGVETQLSGLESLEYAVGNADQDFLNPLGVNCLRTIPNFGRVIWGTRTLSTKAEPEWRYIPVRRTAAYIEQSIFDGIQWAVFEPNNFQLWQSLRTNIEAFMNGLFRAGAFQGQSALQAYFVRCGLGDTMTQGDIDRGQVIAMVGFAPLKPAEFVILRIQQKVGKD